MSTTTDKLVERYLKHLEVELDDIPRDRRREIVDEIAGHIAEARADLHAETEAEIRNILDDLGDPAEIAVEARERFEVQPRKSGFVEIAALILLLLGGFIAGFGWLIGVVLLWSSNIWNTRDKIIGTLIVPGGLALPILLFEVVAWSSGSSGGLGRMCQVDPATGREFNCTPGSETTSSTPVLAIALVIVLVLAPIVTTVYLTHRMRSRTVAAG